MNRSPGIPSTQGTAVSSLSDKLDFARDYFHIYPAMVAAYRLNFWDAIPVDGGVTFDEIVQRTNSSAKGIDALLDVMVPLGAVKYDNITEKFYNEYKRITPFDDAFKVDALGWSVSTQRQFYYLADSIREGRAVGLTKVLGDYESLYEARAEIPEVAKDWDPWMDAFNSLLVQEIQFVYEMPTVVLRIGEGSKNFNGRMLDWCGNDGTNAIRLAKMDPTMQLTVLDLPSQVAKAAELAAAAGLQEQIDTMGVDLFDDNITFEHSYDAVLMNHMNHEWSKENLARFFGMIYPILNPGGLIIVQNDRKHPVGSGYESDRPVQSTIYPLYFVSSAAHDMYPKTNDDLISMVRDVGFVDVEEIPSGMHGVVAVKP